MAETRTNVVFGTGKQDAEILLIGEGPGEREDQTGEPFVGRAGQLLDTLMASVGLSRKHNVYIANMVKCRPPGNRDPQPDEQEACIGFLRTQTALIRPKIIVCLGRVAACRLIDAKFKVTRQHGEFFERNGTLMVGTLHPAAILRDPRMRPDAFADWVGIRDKLVEVGERTELLY